MKIGIYNPYLDSLSGGERYMLTIASGLSKDHDVLVFWDEKDILKKAEERLSIDLSDVKVTKNIFSPGIKLFKSLVTTRKYDLIVVLSDGSIPFINSRFGIIHFQRPFHHVGGRSAVNKIKLRKYQFVICNSQFTKKYIDREYGLSSQVVYPPVDIEKFKNTGKKEKIILSVGRFHPFKKHEMMITAFKKLHKKLPQWKFIIAGGLLNADREYFQSLKELAQDYPIELYENKSFSAIKKIYESASLYWHAAGFGENEKEHPERHEHFGMTPVEAMAAGCIPLVFNGGGLSEIITQGINGFLWNTEDELLSHTQKIIDNRNSFVSIKEEAVKRSQAFSTSQFSNSITTIINSLT